jgi:phosphoribosylglycinamide formyltransferase-1
MSWCCCPAPAVTCRPDRQHADRRQPGPHRCGDFQPRRRLRPATRQGCGHRHPLLDHKAFDGREAFDAALIELIDGFNPKLVVLAGFMRILSADFVRHYQGRLLNIHPSLLPKYKGLHTHQRALEAGDTEHGCSVHFVTEELDGGPLVVQAVVPVELHDSPQSLAQRVHVQEHLIYPMAVRWFAEGRLSLGEQGALLDGQLLAASGHLIRT